MDELICRSLKARTTAAEEEALRAWRRQSERNETRYRELELLLTEAEAVLLTEPVPPCPPTRAVLHPTAPGTRPSATGPFSTRSRRRRTGAGLAVAAAAAVALLILPIARGVTPPPFGLQAGEFVTGATETATAVLSDGTVVRLAPGSRLRVPDQAGTREVVLDGRAYFAVTEVPGHQFRVRTRAGEALVLGTRFEVRVSGDELRLIVLEGRVALGAGGRTVEVGEGEMSVVKEGGTMDPVPVGDLDPLVGWVKRFIVFQATPLHEAVQELERAYGVPVIVTDRLLGQETVTGWYADRSFEEVLMFVCAVVQARCSIGSAKATISPL
jgi:ferric-dicitrate binding protein FerR (iron transport regulator)